MRPRPPPGGAAVFIPSSAAASPQPGPGSPRSGGPTAARSPKVLFGLLLLFIIVGFVFVNYNIYRWIEHADRGPDDKEGLPDPGAGAGQHDPAEGTHQEGGAADNRNHGHAAAQAAHDAKVKKDLAAQQRLKEHLEEKRAADGNHETINRAEVHVHDQDSHGQKPHDVNLDAAHQDPKTGGEVDPKKIDENNKKDGAGSATGGDGGKLKLLPHTPKPTKKPSPSKGKHGDGGKKKPEDKGGDVDSQYRVLAEGVLPLPSLETEPAQENPRTYKAALTLFQANLLKDQKVKQPNDITKEYIDVEDLPDHGVRIPFQDRLLKKLGLPPEPQPEVNEDIDLAELEKLQVHPGHGVRPGQRAPVAGVTGPPGPDAVAADDAFLEDTSKYWVHCDPTDTYFSPERDALCGKYMTNWANMRTITTMPSHLYSGRTIKFKIFYRHGNLTAIVKVPQKKFVFEAASEILAWSVDRATGIHGMPPTYYTALPIDFMRAASGVVSPFMALWFENFVPRYDHTTQRFVTRNGMRCSMVVIQLWMSDVHSALNSALALNYRLDDHLFHKFYAPERKREYAWPPSRPGRVQVLGDICDRFIFDFLLGNTDRGMNDHNNFVYGGCTAKSVCHPPRELWRRTRRPPRYAFLDHGSSFYSHKEPKDSPFTGNQTKICRFRRSTIDKLRHFDRDAEQRHRHRQRPLVAAAKRLLRQEVERHVFLTIFTSVFDRVQSRMEKVLAIVDACVEAHGAANVFVL